MIEKRNIPDYVKRKTIQGRDLVQILFGKKVPEIIEWWIASRSYPKSHSKKERRRSIANEKLAHSILARFHPSPNLVDLKEGLIDIEVNVQEFCSWFLVKADQLWGFAPSPTAKLFVDTALKAKNKKNLKILKSPASETTKKKAVERASHLKQPVVDEAIRIRNEKGITSAQKISRLSRITKILAPSASHTELKNIHDDEYKKRFGRKPGTVEDWIREAFKESSSS